MDIGGTFNVQFVDEFCYHVDKIGVDIDADAALTARIYSG